MALKPTNSHGQNTNTTKCFKNEPTKKVLNNDRIAFTRFETNPNVKAKEVFRRLKMKKSIPVLGDEEKKYNVMEQFIN